MSVIFIEIFDGVFIDFFVGGKVVFVVDGGCFDVYDFVMGEVFTMVVDGMVEDVLVVVDAAVNAGFVWAGIVFCECVEILCWVFELMI